VILILVFLQLVYDILLGLKPISLQLDVFEPSFYSVSISEQLFNQNTVVCFGLAYELVVGIFMISLGFFLGLDTFQYSGLLLERHFEDIIAANEYLLLVLYSFFLLFVQIPRYRNIIILDLPSSQKNSHIHNLTLIFIFQEPFGNRILLFLLHIHTFEV